VRPIKAGDAGTRNDPVVVEYGMTLATLYDMLGAFGYRDEFTKEIAALIERVERERESEQEGPGVAIMVQQSPYRRYV
jgi:hypothetical protein